MRPLILLIDAGIMIYALFKGIGWIKRKKKERNTALRTWDEIVAENRNGNLKEIRIWLEQKYINMRSQIPLSHQVGAMPRDKRNIYSAVMFSESMKEGGIYRFFTGFGRFAIPYAAEAFRAVGADQLLAEYRRFTKDMDLSDVEVFYKDACKRKPQLGRAYDFTGFNERYNRMQGTGRSSVAEKAAFDNSVEKVEKEQRYGIKKAGYKNTDDENLDRLIWKYIERNL